MLGHNSHLSEDHIVDENTKSSVQDGRRRGQKTETASRSHERHDVAAARKQGRAISPPTRFITASTPTLWPPSREALRLRMSLPRRPGRQPTKDPELSWKPRSTATPPLVVEWSTRCCAPTTLQIPPNKPGLEPASKQTTTTTTSALIQLTLYTRKGPVCLLQRSLLADARLAAPQRNGWLSSPVPTSEGGYFDASATKHPHSPE